jgi:hypothetical protein
VKGGAKKSDKFKKMKSRFIEDEADEGSESDDEITGKAPKGKNKPYNFYRV